MEIITRKHEQFIMAAMYKNNKTFIENVEFVLVPNSILEIYERSIESLTDADISLIKYFKSDVDQVEDVEKELEKQYNLWRKICKKYKIETVIEKFNSVYGQ